MGTRKPDARAHHRAQKRKRDEVTEAQRAATRERVRRFRERLRDTVDLEVV